MTADAAPTLSVFASVPQGAISGKKPKILIFDDIAEDPSEKHQDLQGYHDFFTKNGYEVLAVQVVANKSEITSEGMLKSPKGDITRGVLIPQDVKQILTQFKPDVVLTDGQWPDNQHIFKIGAFGGMGGGAAVANIVREHNPAIPCVIHSGSQTHEGIQARTIAGQEYHIASKNDGALEDIVQYFNTKLAQGKRIE